MQAILRGLARAAAMAMFDKRGLGGSAAVLDAPGPGRVPAAEWPVPEPAPAGTLQRRKSEADREAVAASKDSQDESYSPRRQSAAYRWRSLLKTVAGRIVAGSCLAVLLGAVLAAALVVRRSLLHDPRFVVAASAEIQTTGNRHVTRAQVLSMFGSDLERNIFKVPLEQRREDLERLPWVEHATVMRLLPNAIRISLTERTPVAFVRQGSHIGLVDASGVLLDMPEDVAGDPHYSFPVLTGLSADDPLPVRASRMEVYRHFLQELDSSHEKLTDSLSEVDVSNPEDVKAVVTTSGADVLVHFGDEKFLERYKMFEQNLPQWRNQYPKLAAVDTRYDSEFVLEMERGSPVPLSGDGVVGAGSAAAGGNPVRTEPMAKKAVGPGRKAVAASKAVRAEKSKNAAAKPRENPSTAKKPILVHAWTPADHTQVKR